MTPPKPLEFAMVTVTLDHPETDRKKAFEEIRSLLGIGGPEMDNHFGAIPNHGKRDNEFVVLVEENLAHQLQGKNPHVTGVFANPKLDTFFLHGGCVPPGLRDKPPGPPSTPPATRGGPRRNPKP
jgi:hypothetical protein